MNPSTVNADNGCCGEDLATPPLQSHISKGPQRNPQANDLLVAWHGPHVPDSVADKDGIRDRVVDRSRKVFIGCKATLMDSIASSFDQSKFGFAAMVLLLVLLSININNLWKNDLSGSSDPIGETFSAPISRNLMQETGQSTSFPHSFSFKKQESLHSSVHCIGENFGPDAWMYRSCQFWNLCFDVTQREFVVFPSPQELKLRDLVKQMQSTVTISSLSSYETSQMAVGSIDPKFSTSDLDRLKWFPRVAESNEILGDGYLELPADVVVIPFRSNSNRLLWDDVFSIFVLLETFGLSNSKRMPLQLQSFPSDCKPTSPDAETCKEVLLLLDPAILGITQGAPRIISIEELALEARQETQNDIDARFLCAPRAVAGIGMLSGTRTTRYDQPNLQQPSHLQHTGATRAAFTRFLLRNLGLDPQQQRTRIYARKVIFAIYKSRQEDQGNSYVSDFDLETLAKRTKQVLASSHYDNVVVESCVMDGLSLRQQAEIVMNSAVFIAEYGGGGAIAASFLPQNSSFVVFHDSKAQPSQGWEMWKNAWHLRVHWISIPKQQSDDSFHSFIDMVVNELDLLQLQTNFQ
ncbi:hypothetical protein ACA910_005278 [Epithemia clementina (nom. ined.)]